MQPRRCTRDLFLCAALLLTACDADQMPSQSSGRAFGTTWSLKASRNASLHDDLQPQLDAWEAIISNWKPDSTVSRFNASTSTEWQAMPVEVIELVRLAERIAQDTEDALDITLGPLIDLWGFGAGGRRETPPSEAEITTAREACGWHRIEMRDSPPALRKKHPALRLNLSAVAEGWALEKLAARLEAAGHADFLLELGGEVLARGCGPDGQPWLVGVQMPERATGEVMQTLRLEKATLATSGTYRQAFEAGGRSYSHLLDPRTGRPVAHSLRSVSVIHADAALADGYATALLVLGRERGRVIAEKRGLRVLWVE